MSSETFKQKYAKGSSQVPTLEECYNSLDCKKHFLSSVKKYSKYFSEEEMHDLLIDSYYQAINNFNGKSAFLTFLYRVSFQLAIIKLKKKIRASSIKLGKNIDSVTSFTQFKFFLDLTEEEIKFLNLKYVEKLNNSELMEIYKCNKYEIRQKITKLKTKLKEVV